MTCVECARIDARQGSDGNFGAGDFLTMLMEHHPPWRLTMKRLAHAAALVGAIALGSAYSSSAAPVLSNTAAVKDAAPGDVIDVRNGGAFFGGLVVGGLIGSAIARPYYYPYPYYGYYGYPYPYYGYPYGYYPRYYGYYPYRYYPRYRYRHRHYRR
jgi:hypothetical protein